MKSTTLIVLFALAGTTLAADPVPLLSWNFNEGGGDYTTNIGSGSEASLYPKSVTSGNVPFSADAQGLSGKPNDYALDLTSSTGMGATTPASNGPCGVVWSTSPGLQSLSGLSSFTIVGWLKPEAPINRAARIVVSQPFMLMAGTENRLTLVVNGANPSEQSLPYYQEINNWMFFAVTYDSTKSVNNVIYYVGTAADGSLSQAGMTTLNAGPLPQFGGQMLVGNNASGANGTRPFKGLIDNLAIYGTKDNSSGALSMEQLEAIRVASLR